jgi:hypothetical protein
MSINTGLKREKETDETDGLSDRDIFPLMNIKWAMLNFV